MDAERVLLGEPWSYDRHLVILQRFDGSKSVKEIEFIKCKFWIQIHDIQFKYVTSETAIEIRESIGHVSIPQDSLEMKGGTFMRVRVAVDISRPLCRGRKVSFMDNMEGWVLFQYERLLNLYFWCGLLSHDDKDCEILLKSKGTIPLERQQYGHWIKALVFSMSKCQVIDVKGFDDRYGRRQRSQSPGNASTRQTNIAFNLLVPVIIDGEGSKPISVKELVVVAPPMESNEVTLPNDDPGVIMGLSKNTKQLANFEVIIGEIDKEPKDNAPISNSLVVEVIHKIQGRSSNEVGAGLS